MLEIIIEKLFELLPFFIGNNQLPQGVEGAKNKNIEVEDEERINVSRYISFYLY